MEGGALLSGSADAWLASIANTENNVSCMEKYFMAHPSLIKKPVFILYCLTKMPLSKDRGTTLKRYLALVVSQSQIVAIVAD
jgi:hypothetical protein